MNKKVTFVKSFSILTAITLIEKIIAFVFEAIIAAKLGAGIITDGYFTTAEMFTLIDSAFISSLTVVALNVYSKYVNQEDEKQAFNHLSDLQSFYLPLMLLLSLLIFVFAKPLSYIVAPGYDSEARNIVIRCIHIMSIVPSIVCITSLRLSVLRQKKIFSITGLKSLFISVVGIVSVLLATRYEVDNADCLSVAFVTSTILYCVLCVICSARFGHVKLHLPKLTDDVKVTIKMLLPLMMSYGVARLALMVDKIIASSLGEGAVSSLTYAHSLYKVVGAIFITNLSVIILTDFNNLCAKRQNKAIANKLKNTIAIMTIILLPITLVSVFCSNEIVEMVYERGSFTNEITEKVGLVLLFYALNFIPAMIHGLYNQVMYAYGDTKRPMWIAFLSVILNLGFSIPLAFTIGISGVAIGTFISSVFCTIILGRWVRNLIPEYNGCYKKAYVLRIAIASVFTTGVLYLVSRLSLVSIVTFILASVLGFVIFFSMELLMKEPIFIEYAKKLLKRYYTI